MNLFQTQSDLQNGLRLSRIFETALDAVASLQGSEQRLATMAAEEVALQSKLDEANNKLFSVLDETTGTQARLEKLNEEIKFANAKAQDDLNAAVAAKDLALKGVEESHALRVADLKSEVGKLEDTLGAVRASIDQANLELAQIRAAIANAIKV